jgi:protein-tyrosine phosphatase
LKPGFTPKSILVLCEGNHCRSPIAEGLLKAGLAPGIQIESAGLGAKNGYAPHTEAIKLMAEQGIDITRYRSRQVTPAMALAADFILVMEQDQKEWCETQLPSTRGRVFLLGCWLPPEQQEIPDPLNKPKETFALVFETIFQSVIAWRNHLSTPGRTQ